jgi:hypothetical protein
VAQSSVIVALSPEQLGELGAQIKQPNDADKLRADHGLTRFPLPLPCGGGENPADAKPYACAYKAASW